ncbi:hypothetical protein KC622_03720, partial [Candidatus Dojkabacteria bacterium]|nr:hypothetical protein [Candidatus Dojkabacteria bacterium]
LDREYLVEIYKDNKFEQLIYQSDWQEQSNITLNLDEGVYYWIIRARSNGIISISDINTLIIDRTSYERPSTSDLFIPPDKNIANLSVESTEDEALLIVRYSLEESFEEYAELLTTFPESVISNLPEGLLYFQAKLVDLAGNASEWSQAVSAVIDTIPPQFENLLIEPTNISPRGKDGIQDQLEIEVDVNEDNFKEIIIQISKLNGERVFEQLFTDRNVSLTWPSDIESEEGEYLVYIKAEENSGDAIATYTQKIVVDNTAPIPTLMSIPELTDNVTNAHKLTLEFDKKPKELEKISLNGELVKAKTEKLITINLEHEGQNSLQLTYSDAAGNTTEETFNFFVDWSPPLRPDIEITPNYYDKSLELKITNEEAVKAYVYDGETLIDEIDLEESNQKLVVEEWEPQKEYYLKVVTEDQAGNKSEPSESEIFLSPEDELGIGNGYEGKLSQIKTSGTCKYDLNEHTGKISKGKCTIKAPLIKSAKAYKTSSGKYLITVEGEYLPFLQVEITSYRCQKRTLLKPKTLFRCVLKY